LSLPSRRDVLLTPLVCWRPTPPRAVSRELRFPTPKGSVRAYWPAGYRAATAGVVVYVHGLYTTVDDAWREHHLPEQFAASARNAVFIAAPSRSKTAEPPRYLELSELLDVVAGESETSLPTGRIVLAAHSGGYQQVAAWLDDSRISCVLMLDALYGHEADLRAWLERRPEHRMALVSNDTRKAARAWARTMPFAVRRPLCPTSYAALSRRERAAKLLCLGTTEGHFEIVTAGHALPLLLRWSGLGAV
jgi:hypothetical protein